MGKSKDLGNELTKKKNKIKYFFHTIYRKKSKVFGHELGS